MTENDKCALVNNEHDLAAGGLAGSREASCSAIISFLQRL